MKLFFTPSTAHLKRSFSMRGCDLGAYEFYTFADGERGYRLKDEVRGKGVAIIASIFPDPASLFDLMALHLLVRENKARKTILVVPYLGYARQDRPSHRGEGSLGIMVLELIQKMASSRLLLFDIHSHLIRKALRRPATELSALPLFAQVFSKDPPEVIVSPDAGFVPRAKELAELLKPHPEVAVIEKVRPRPNIAIAKKLHGDVKAKKVVLVDDIIDTGGTLAEAVKLVSAKGARSIRLAATHGLFSGHARERLSRLPVKEILVTNTLPQIRYPKFRVLDITPLIVKALRC
jgi:ribose-phosphate pyrophosphokinase